MIAVEEGLASILLADTVVAGLVGTRIEPNQSTEAFTSPRIVYQRISTPRIRHLGGRSMLAYPRFQVNCFAFSYTEAKQLAAAVVDALDTAAKYRTTQGGWFMQAMLVMDERDIYSSDQHAADVGVHQVSVDVIIWHNEV